QCVAAIEFDVLKRVENVKTSDPRRDRDREHAQHPPRTGPRPRYRQITADWRYRESHAKHNVRPASESFCEAVEKDPAQRDRRQKKADVIELECGEQEHTAGDRYRDHRLGNTERSRWQLAHLRSRIQRIELPIRYAVESHRGEACRGERDHDPANLPQRYGRVIARKHHTDERERQREKRVWKLHEVHVPDHARCTMKCLPFTCRHSPSSPHMASTRAFVASSIVIRAGQLRVNPSSGNLRVASIPILDPYVNALLE